MKNKKTLIILSVILIAVIIATPLVFSSLKSYTDQYSSHEIYDYVKNSYNTNGGNIILDDNVIIEFTDEELPYLVDYIVVKSNNAKNINEIGIFKVESGKSKELKKIVTDYLEGKQQLYRAMDYFPEEVEKIDCAKVVVYGNYVIYSFLNESDTSSFYSSIENLIKK